MTMRDVLDNMEEMAGEYAFRDMGGDFEILAIEPSEHSRSFARDSRVPRTREIFSAELTDFPLRARQVA
jgi:hypothetical protein